MQHSKKCFDVVDVAQARRHVALVREYNDAEAVGVVAANCWDPTEPGFPILGVIVETHVRLDLDESLVECEGGNFSI